jgi:sugar phosphate isomerase/epimerase
LEQFAGAIEPIKRPGKPRLMLSLAAYSFREFFNAKDPAKKIDLFKFIDYCAEQGCDGTELTSYYFPKDVTPEQLLEVRRHVFLRGLAISGTAVGNDFAKPKGEKLDEQIRNVKKWIDNAAILGAPHIRIFAGHKAPEGMTDAEARKLSIEPIQECCDYASKKGIFLGLENHGGIVNQSDWLLEIVKQINSPWLGINLDSGNFKTEDPYADIIKCMPYAVNVQIKPYIHRPNEKQKEKPDLARLFKIFREANYQGFVALEYEANEDPWKAVPEWLAEMKTFMRG